MVAPLVEALLLHAMRRRAATSAVPAPRPNRLVGRSHPVDSVAFVADGTSVLLSRPHREVQVLPGGSLVLPAVLARGASTYVVVSHAPVDVWLRVGPFETRDDRLVEQVELRLTVALGDSPAGLRELVEESGPDGLGEALLDPLAREVATRTTEAVRRRSLVELTDLSLGVLLDGALPGTFLGGLLDRSDLEVLDVDWPTEGRGFAAPGRPAPTGAAGNGPVPR